MQKETMKNTEPADGAYSLSDFYLAAYLICSGMELLRTDRAKPNRVVFVLADSQQRPGLIQDFYSRKARIDPLAYKDTIANLKSLIHGFKAGGVAYDA